MAKRAATIRKSRAIGMSSVDTRRGRLSRLPWRAMRVAMLLQKSSRHDNRVLREARALVAAGHSVTVVELAPPAADRSDEAFALVSALPPASVKRYLPF